MIKRIVVLFLMTLTAVAVSSADTTTGRGDVRYPQCYPCGQ